MNSPDARELMLLAGERTIAERGPHVALRDIAVAAGQRNNSAVHYHFGSRDGLIAAIIERHQPALETRRTELLAEHEASGAPDSVSALVAILVRPMFDVPYAEGSTHYARFLEQARAHPAVTGPNLNEKRWQTTRVLVARLYHALAELTPAQRRYRLQAMTTVMFALLADYERFAQPDEGERNDARESILAMIVGLLSEPVRAGDHGAAVRASGSNPPGIS
ncbi:TetR family transcriptional regulator [Nocardia tengchongensis]|uniref:TetR family transcriptional regulator n=1 Tax=Nocardia tengchongensis TaxID=2055889 RepID=A0ABX8CTP7_9NOCA|nr:TetR/AcrR family transcriptional regulator [Nocardia tengchongensis]QVI23287.1 TetR family transcriptional regulator [Nocardia tengchongensis]